MDEIFLQIKQLDYQAKEAELHATFKNLELRDYGLRCLSKIEEIFGQVLNKALWIEKGGTGYQSSIIKDLDFIENNLIQNKNFPVVFQSSEVEALEGFFSPFKKICLSLREIFGQSTRKENSKQPTQGSDLLDEQNLLDALPEFHAFLGELQSKVRQQSSQPAKVYFAYAWPTPSNLETENWVQPFLQTFKRHLDAAGVNSAYLDVESNRYGTSIYTSMQQAETSEYVLLFGTPSLLEKHEGGVSAVCAELIHILHKRQQDLAHHQSRVFPLLLVGSCQEAFPPEFERYCAIMDWRNKGYLAGFQEIYLELFGLRPERYLPSIRRWMGKKLWSFLPGQKPLPITHQKTLETKKSPRMWASLKSRQALFLVSVLVAILMCVILTHRESISSLFHRKHTHVHVRNTHRDFVGRESYLGQLKRVCLGKKFQKLPITVLWGEGGIGKSEIAIAFARKYLKHFSFVFQIECDNSEVYRKSYQKLAGCLKIPYEHEDDTKFLIKRVHEYLEQHSFSKPWLLIYDNTYEALDLPSRGEGCVLVTTRCRTGWRNHHCLQVSPFSEEEALELFSVITQKKATAMRKELIRELERFPLVLNQTAHYITQIPGMTEKKYLALLRRDKPLLIEAIGLPAQYPYGLQASWAITSNHLKKRDALAYECLYFFSYLYPYKIPLNWMKKWLLFRDPTLSSFQINIIAHRILKILYDWSLIRYDKATETIFLHRLRQELLQNEVKDDLERLRVLTAFFRKVTENIGGIEEVEWNMKHWGILTEWEPHILWTLNTYSDKLSPEDLVYFKTLIGNFKWVYGEYDQAELFHREALDILRQDLSHQTAKIATALKDLGKCLERKGKYLEALKLHQEALDLRIRLFGEEHIDVSHSLHNLAWVSIRLGKYEKAREIYEKVLVMRKKLLGEHHVYVGNALHFLGVTLFNQGNYVEAKRYLKKGLNLRKMIHGEQHSDVAHSLHYLAQVAIKLGNYNQAFQLNEKSMGLRKKLHGIYHPYTTSSMQLFAEIYSHQGNYDHALELHLQVLKQRKKQYGLSHPHVAMTLNELGAVSLKQGQFSKALEFHKDALGMQVETLGQKHHVIGETLCYLGEVMLEFGRYQEAESYFEAALELNEESLPPSHPDVTKSMDLLARSYRKQGRYQESQKLFIESLERKKQQPAGDVSRIQESHVFLGLLFEKIGEYRKSLWHLEQALDMQIQILGDQHPDVAEVYCYLGWIYAKIGQYKKCEEFHYKGFKIREKVFGLKHPCIIDSMLGCGWAKGKLGFYRESKKMFTKALALAQVAYGSDHPMTFRCNHYLAWDYGKLKMHTKAKELHEKNLERRKEFYGDNHFYVLTSKIYLGRSLGKLKNYDCAQELLEEALAIRKESLTEHHPDAVKNLYFLAWVLYKKGECEKAEKLFFEVLDMRKSLFGEAHPEVANVFYTIAKNYDRQGKHEEAMRFCHQSFILHKSLLGTTHPITIKTYKLLSRLTSVGSYFGPALPL